MYRNPFKNTDSRFLVKEKLYVQEPLQKTDSRFLVKESVLYQEPRISVCEGIPVHTVSYSCLYLSYMFLCVLIVYLFSYRFQTCLEEFL